MATQRRSVLVFPLIVLGCSLLGGYLGPGLPGASAATPEDDIKSSMRTFTKVLNVVEENAAETVNPDKSIYKGAIPGMLRTLDPHSSFFDPKDYQALREDQKGHYYGVGMTVGPRNGKTIVISPFTGAPAYKAGIRPGDVIVEVNDKKTDNLTTTEIADLLKGPRGTIVQVVVQREGVEKPITFNITRDEINRKSVKDAFWLKPGVMYMSIEQFNENTSREMEDNFKRLGESNVKGLVLDLRHNPGGLLNEGVAVSGHFLAKGQAVVSHRGRASADKTYTARNGSSNRDYPIVVLVDRYSASAAEIVSGALQDHDRAWILGDQTFGKGLVQTVYPLSENTGLALTTAHFYTPSGRLIQRDYSNISFYDYYYHRQEGLKNEKDIKTTDSGRTVYGGGGITPDEHFTPPKYNKFQVELLTKGSFFNYASHYFATHDPSKMQRNWQPDSAAMEDFHQYVLKNGVQFTEAEFTENHEWVRQELRRELFGTAFGADVADELRVSTDPTVLKAIESMPKAKELLETAKKQIVQRFGKDTR